MSADTEFPPDPTPDDLLNGWGSLFDENDEDADTLNHNTEYDSDRLSDASDWDPVEVRDEEVPRVPPIHLAQTRALRDRLSSANKAERVVAILEHMESLDMNVPIFLDALSWGDDGCISNAKIQYARTALMVSEELPGILERWHKVPQASTSRHHHVRPQGARKALEKFALDCVANIMDRELEASAPIFRSSKSSLSEEGLKSFQFREVARQLQEESAAPNTYRLLHGAMCRALRRRGALAAADRVRQGLSRKHTDAWTKPLTVFLKAKGVSAKALDLLHVLGVSMSHSWSVRAYARISAHAMETVRLLILVLLWWLAYDNVNFAFRVFSQRINNQSHFDSGTTGSIFVKPFAPQAPPLRSDTLREQRIAGRLNPITLDEIVSLEVDAAPRIHSHIVNAVLRMLLDCPEFNIGLYSGKDNTILSPPPPVHQLPSGPLHITKQYVLGTVHIDESSYEGTDDLIKEWFRQLHLNGIDEQVHTGLDRVVVWIGDQLTVERLRGLWNFRCEDRNPYDRLDWLVVVFGWFHLLMAFANSLHRQYFGSTSGKGLRQAFALLNRKGLQSVQIKGPFHHHLHEGILHVAEAHILDCWKRVGKVSRLEDLRDRAPEELMALAENLVETYASNDAVEDLEAKMDDQGDEVLQHAIMWNRDVLYYIILHRAIRTGDVGMMEDLLPHLFLRFAGGRNHKYAVECLELLQGLHREWPDDVKRHIRENCWLVNLKGAPRTLKR
ncbi:hypothetical protein C8Q80DRAFT_1278719 [Daedaleopsis nitida]|nr:hypothetical protein C8Q80DRAFT_1278719 [Daedaleopsis nitida]